MQIFFFLPKKNASIFSALSSVFLVAVFLSGCRYNLHLSVSSSSLYVYAAWEAHRCLLLLWAQDNNVRQLRACQHFIPSSFLSSGFQQLDGKKNSWMVRKK